MRPNLSYPSARSRDRQQRHPPRARGTGELQMADWRPSIGTRILCWLCSISLLLPLVLFPLQPVQEAAAARGGLRRALTRAVTAKMGVAPPAGIVITKLKRVDDWRYGTVGVRLPAGQHGGPAGFLFVAHKQARGWNVTLEGS